MEATGRGGGRWPSWSYRRHEETGSGSHNNSSSSRSGTIPSNSTAYPSGGHSTSSTSISMEWASLRQQLDLELSVGTTSIQVEADKKEEAWETLSDIKMKNIKSLVQEFFCAPSSENRSIVIRSLDDMAPLERWFFELEAGFFFKLDPCVDVLELDIFPFSESMTSRWVRALTQIMETIHLTEFFFSDHGHGFVGMSQEEVESGQQAATGLDLAVQFALFFQEAMSKMLVFVDLMFSDSQPLSASGSQGTSASLVSGLSIHSALSEASRITLQFRSPPPAEVKQIEEEMVSLLSAKQGEAFEAIWSALELFRTHALNSMLECSSGTPQGSSDIDEVTHLAMDHINFLLNNESTLTPLVSKAASVDKYVPLAHITGFGEASPFITLISEMVSSLHEILLTKSKSFGDEGLRFLFLLNNSNYIRERATKAYLTFNIVLQIVTRHKDELAHYIESYIQVSWAPMLSCLSNHTPLCLGRNYSPLSKFDSEFQKIYTTQKLWKVPDPGLRKRLREAVIEKVIPGYTNFIEDNKGTKPNFTPQELEEMLQDLFEG